MSDAKKPELSQIQTAAMDLISKLSEEITRVPTALSRHLQKAIESLEWEANRTPHSDMVLVMQVLDDGAYRIEDVLCDTHLTMNEVRPILIKLIELNYVMRFVESGTGRGRAAHIYRLSFAGEMWLEGQ